MNRNGVLLALVLAVLILGGTSAYSSWIAASNGRAYCDSQNRTLNTLHDVVVLAFTPPPGRTLKAEQVKEIQQAEARIFTRIDEARC